MKTITIPIDHIIVIIMVTILSCVAVYKFFKFLKEILKDIVTNKLKKIVTNESNTKNETNNNNIIKKMSCKEAYQLTEPHLCNNVWKEINNAIESGAIFAYVSGDRGKVPSYLIEELIDLGYSIEVRDYDFNKAPSITIYFNKESTGELLMEFGDTFNSQTRPISIEEYEKLGRRK